MILAFCIFLWMVYKYVETVSLIGFPDGYISEYEYAIKNLYYSTSVFLFVMAVTLLYQLKNPHFLARFHLYKFFVLFFIFLMLMYLLMDYYFTSSLSHGQGA